MFEHTGVEDRSFRDLWQDYSLGIMAFAQIASVEPQIVRDMLYGHPVSPDDAQKVFVKVSEMLEARDTVENSAVLPAQPLQDEIALFLQRTGHPPPWQEE